MNEFYVPGMKRLRKLINALTDSDRETIAKSFYRPTDKVAVLFSKLIEGQPNEAIRDELNLSTNAYTTLGSRLNEKIQNHLIELADSPKEDVLRKLYTIEAILFDEEPTIAQATLKKLERELIRYDLSNELTIVYKYLKKLNLNKQEYFHYSQLYNRHVGYSLALDKAEDILGNYFKEYGFFLAMRDKHRKETLGVIFEEMKNVCALYQSHRMQINLALMEVIHRLYVDEAAFKKFSLKPIEDIFDEVDKVFELYPKDKVYFHLQLSFKHLRFEYYLKHGIHDKAIQLADQLLTRLPQLLIHYENNGFPAQLLDGILRLRFEDAEQPKIGQYVLSDALSFENASDPAKVIINFYKAIMAFHDHNFAEAARFLFELSNQVSFKDHSGLLAEVKCMTAYVKFFQRDMLLFRQNLSSAQRLLRTTKSENVTHLVIFTRLLTAISSSSDRNRESRIDRQLVALAAVERSMFMPVLYLNPTTAELMSRIN